MPSLAETMQQNIASRDVNLNTPKASENHRKRISMNVGARTKSVCFKVSPDMYDRFKSIVEARGQKANALINQWITEYVNQNEGKW